MTDIEGVIHVKPPRPVPFGGGPRAASDSNVRQIRHQESIGAQSADSRGALRAEISKRRTSLTPQELGFLEELIDHGNEVELTVARETLRDSDLFFTDDDDGWCSDISLGVSEQTSASLTAEDIASIFRTSQRLRSSSETFGSAKRLEHLERRRKSQVMYGKMWKAHEHGFPFVIGMRQRSRSIACLREEKSNVVRRSSFLSQETADLLANGGPLMKEGGDGVFRRQNEDRVFRQPLSPKDRVTNNDRRVSWNKAGAQKLLKTRRPSFRRLESGGSRKSVSFAECDDENGDHPTRLPGIPRRVTRTRNVSTDTEISALETELDDEPSIPSLHHARPIRSDSVSSIPSLHHPEPVRSESVSSIPSLHHPNPVRSDSVSLTPSLHLPNFLRFDSVSSIPSLHHPNPVRSNSIASIHSIHHAHRINSESNLRTQDVETSNEYVDTSMMSEVSLMSIPSLHHGHPLRDESIASFTSSPETREPEQVENKTQLLRHPEQPQQRPVLMRRASANNYNGEGIEVEEIPPEIGAFEVDSIQKARTYKSLISFGGSTVGSVLSCSSFDRAVNREDIFREHRRSLSDEGRSSFFLGSTSKRWNDASKARRRLYYSNMSCPFSIQTGPLSESAGYSRTSINTLRPEEGDGDESWDLEADSPKGQYDAWNVLEQDPSYGAGEGGFFSFRILGTSADDEAATPHVLSPPLMDSLRNFFPYSMSESNFWMKYSLLRDGASFHSMLQKIRGATHTIVAIETVDGEVFGSFTSEPWRKNWKYFGNGESFLWRMRQSRKTPCFDVFDQAKMESELDVYPWSGHNDCVQLCTHDTIAVGGGTTSDEKKNDDAESTTEYGFGFAIEKELLYGTSSSCATFSSPPLSIVHKDGSPFEIVNLEVWALTPCDTLEEAQKLELGQLFLRSSTY